MKKKFKNGEDEWQAAVTHYSNTGATHQLMTLALEQFRTKKIKRESSPRLWLNNLQLQDAADARNAGGQIRKIAIK